jgi:cytochrome c-type biogenesis protein CcmH/NrfG
MERRRLLLFSLVLSLLSTFGWFLAPAAGQVEKREQVGGVAPEPPDAADLSGQIARIEKALPQLPDRGAGLYLLSTLKQRQGETREAIKLLRECLALNAGFDPAGSPSLSKLKGSRSSGTTARPSRPWISSPCQR